MSPRPLLLAAAIFTPSVLLPVTGWAQGPWERFQAQAGITLRALEQDRPTGDEAVAGEPAVDELALVFGQLFEPMGDRGLEFSAGVRLLEGHQVTIRGYMVRDRQWAPRLFVLAPRPIRLDTSGSGEVLDLPPTAVYVHLSGDAPEVPVGYRPGLVVVRGQLELGPQTEANGRNSFLRLRLDSTTSAGMLPGH
jgi:hypothetical protein